MAIHTMRKTLRRSCDACARSKLACDLQTPRCSRCAKRDLPCAYANQPLSAAPRESATSPPSNGLTVGQETTTIMLVNPGIQSFDPFDTYPQTRLPRPHVQQLIQHFLSHIAFQYYPLDLDIMSNPFVVSWWPLALADPALFHVSLQTASLDLDLRAQKGFANSEILMADSVSLVRQKINDPTSALQDETMDSIITLAAIEYGKGNTDISALHVDGVKRLVELRGGINSVRRTSPLTARMVAWVCMIVTQTPQFPAQDGNETDEAIVPISQWYEATSNINDTSPIALNVPVLDPDITDVLCRLHNLFDSNQHSLSSTDLHDLTCYAVHRLLLWSPQPQTNSFLCDLAASGTVRHALVLYLLIIHGPTYFSHARLQYAIMLKLQAQMELSWFNMLYSHGSLTLWLLFVGMVASEGTPEGQWFANQARTATEFLGLQTWADVVVRLQGIVWLDSRAATSIFQQKWQEVRIFTPT
ncbi:hypothetical protein C7974DRAFT_139569 [Boeremia exigua]|uniref:uncharacterized protein n=1 Tax=Boeremia exigua TaxID=749465 RepID=UPI001E8E92D1|nr:uncharacterized protein C7974DRAFT_139569 [Boeremia exigua]KAH6639845.1 hypothetical protein C7974DRAFT_139569 [Boeremia exigua]